MAKYSYCGQDILSWQNILVFQRRRKKLFAVAKYSNFGQDILQWQSILVFQKEKVFLCGKIFKLWTRYSSMAKYPCFSEKSFPLWQNILILDKIFIDGDPPRLPSQATKHQTEASSHLELNRKQIDLTS